MDARNAESDSPKPPPSPESAPPSSSVGLEPLLLRLCEAIEQQTLAINALAASNEELVDLIVSERDQDDEDAEQGFDMAGRPLSQ